MSARRPRTLGRVVPVAVLLAALAACTHAPRRSEPEESPRPSSAAPAGEEGEVGLASFYARKFHGRRTASGARYDMHAMTCAHPRAPFGARLKVTDLENGRSVVVTVTDRGPFKRGRVVDLSMAAARKLGIVDRGLARVRVEAVED
ncbi:septal ring lytic transglycosylase RlpA family protein [Anaeromyxobacter soli]|uniref:septal ring lytic transglycosylase RlpA family protein n=1 Tax=Anaeromyxobacter soli TaxID=2922725 RepID=UPI001FAFC5E1|nr:septal ring lytic transglycosylase RlpA family protein [Anaeromyxobacter sp. SG29]